MPDNYYQEITAAIQEQARELLQKGQVEKIIGYGQQEYMDEITPLFLTEADQCERLIFNVDCSMMLAKYLLKYPDTEMGIVAKPCDTRAIASYLSEDLLAREKLVIIGINGCQGIDGNTACAECTVRNPVLADYTAGEPATGDDSSVAGGDGQSAEDMIAGNENDRTSENNEDDTTRETVAINKSAVSGAELEAMTPEERMEYFRSQFSRCIQCYACREACHVCYCEECFVDSNQPFWLGESTELNDNFTFHLMRSMHMAGRCINCGACEVACPEGIDVRALTAKLYRSAEEIFDYQAGIDPEDSTLLNDYDVNDPQPGFLD